MLIDVAYVLAGLVGAGCVLMGANAFRAPQAAAGFGIPDTPTGDPVFRAWLTVKAVRDIVAGLLVFVVMAGGTAPLLGWFLLVAAGIPVGDALIVLRSGGPRGIAYGVHAATAAVMIAISLLLLLG